MSGNPKKFVLNGKRVLTFLIAFPINLPAQNRLKLTMSVMYFVLSILYIYYLPVVRPCVPFAREMDEGFKCEVGEERMRITGI